MDEEDVQDVTATLAAAKEFSMDVYRGLPQCRKLFSADSNNVVVTILHASIMASNTKLVLYQ